MKQKTLMVLGWMGLMSMGIYGCGAFDSDSMDGVLPRVAISDAPANSEDESVVPSSAILQPESKCHVEALSNGARIWCDDGTSVSIFNGQNGIAGVEGINADPCSTEQTVDGATLICPNGTSAYVLHGQDGQDGANGLNGIDGINGTDGVAGLDGTDGTDGIDGVNGVDGIDGTTCTTVQTVGGSEIQCSDGTVASIQNGLDGPDGIDGSSCTVIQDVSGATVQCGDGTSATLLNGVDAATGAPIYSNVVYDPVSNSFTYLRVADLYTCTLSVATNESTCIAPTATLN